MGNTTRHFAPSKFTLRLGQLLGTDHHLIYHLVILTHQLTNLIIVFILNLSILARQLDLFKTFSHHRNWFRHSSVHHPDHKDGKHHNNQININDHNQNIHHIIFDLRCSRR